MVVGTVGDHLVTSFHESVGHSVGVELHLLDVLSVVVGQSFAESDSLSGDDVLQRTTLATWEHGRVEDLGHHLHDALRGGLAPRILEVLAQHDETAARSTEGLVGGGGHDVTVLHSVVQQTLGDEAGGVGDVSHQDGTDLVGDLAHACPIPVAAVSGSTADDQLRFFAESHFLHRVVVDAASLFVNLVSHRMIEDTGRVHWGTV